MLTCPTHVPIYFYAQPVDLRKGFDGLCGIVETAFGRRVTDGQFVTITTNHFSDDFVARLGGTVREIHRMSLEEIFLSLTTEEAPTPAPADDSPANAPEEAFT